MNASTHYSHILEDYSRDGWMCTFVRFAVSAVSLQI